MQMVRFYAHFEIQVICAAMIEDRVPGWMRHKSGRRMAHGRIQHAPLLYAVSEKTDPAVRQNGRQEH